MAYKEGKDRVKKRHSIPKVEGAKIKKKCSKCGCTWTTRVLKDKECKCPKCGTKV